MFFIMMMLLVMSMMSQLLLVRLRLDAVVGLVLDVVVVDDDYDALVFNEMK